MAKLKRLRDIYRFPGFVPLPNLRGLFGDPLAVIITLQRRRKKRSAVSVGLSITPPTTSDRAASAISPAATSGSTSLSRSAASRAPSVAA
jgi:hypothetical protein